VASTGARAFILISNNWGFSAPLLTAADKARVLRDGA